MESKLYWRVRTGLPNLHRLGFHPVQPRVELDEKCWKCKQSHRRVEPIGPAPVKGQRRLFGQVVEHPGNVLGFPTSLVAIHRGIKDARQAVQVDDCLNRTTPFVEAIQCVGVKVQDVGQTVDQGVKRRAGRRLAAIQAGDDALQDGFRSGDGLTPLQTGGQFGHDGNAVALSDSAPVGQGIHVRCQENSVGAAVKNAFLIRCGAAAGVNQEWQVAFGQALADEIGERPGKGTFAAQGAHEMLVGLACPVALSIGGGPYDVMRYPALAQGAGEAVGEHRLAAVRRSTDKDSRELFHFSQPRLDAVNRE